MLKNSYKAWRFFRILNCEKGQNQTHVTIRPNQIAQQLIINGKTKNKRLKIKKSQQKDKEENHFKDSLTLEEVNEAIDILKPRKVSGVDEVMIK